MPPDTSPIRAFLKNNRGLKILALVLATISWYAIQEAVSSEAIIKNVRLLVLADDGWTVLDQFPTEVDVVFRGSDQELRFLQRDQIAVQVSVRGTSSDGVMVVKLKPEHVKAPSGARPVRVDPAEITLSLDREADKEVPVKVDISGSPPDGFDVEKIVPTPATVVLHGPRQRLVSIDSVRTDPLDLAGRTRSFRLNRALRAPPDSGGTRMEPDVVRLDITIVEGSSDLTLEGVRVHTLIQPERRELIRVTPSTIRITVAGRPEYLAKLDKSRLVAFVDCSAIQPGPGINLPVRVHPVPGLTVKEIEPPMVTAEVGEGN
jgi:YbbR domain-containing protein